ncbi:expressed conserved protein [Echinococcus multilocularis]|uniref:Expressed conserved protein n=1 Tax=Echinococcus multilocularis TaxID=6211 RepID=A0A068Y567_ECHMU|nr:expressed conserved protein [Echinococcus multilocularis]
MDAGTIFDDRPRAETLPHLLSGINMEYIGETHQALEQELDYQTYLEEELKKCVSRGLYPQQDASNLQTLININREHLEFLSPITSLEHMFSEMAQKVSDRAVDLVNAQGSPEFWDRNLSKNTRACWKTVQRFSNVSRVHISNASEYHLFYYNCDHFLKSLQKRAEANYDRYKDIDVEYPSITTTRLNSYITEGLFKFQSLASEVLRILDKARRVHPVYLRVRGLNRPVSGIMLCDYSTKNFGLRVGQHVYVLDNAYATPLTTISETTDTSEASECSTCLPYCSLHRRPGCAICGLPLSTSTETTNQTDVEDVESGSVTEEEMNGRRRRNASESSTATGSASGPSDVSISATPPGCSRTLCSQREPVMWKVRTMDGSLTVDVPAVTVMVNEHDEEAINHAYEIYDFFTNMWREAIDIWLMKGVKALSAYFSSLIDAKYIRLENERVFEQFLEEVERAFPCEDPESGTANKFLNELITTLREKISRQDPREETSEHLYVKITEVASYRKTVQKLRDHVNQIKRFMKDVEENTSQDILGASTTKSIGDLKYVYEESVEEHKKLEKMIRQVNTLRTQQRSPRVPIHKVHTFFGEYYSSSEELSGESETSDLQYDIERNKDLSPHEFQLYIRDAAHRGTALTNRPRYVRRPHRKAIIVDVDDLLTESSDEGDTGQPRKRGRLLYKPTRKRPGERISEVIEETKDSVVSSMTLNRKINLEKAMRRRGEVPMISSPDGRYRSRRQLQFTPGPQKGDVSIVYLQITAAKSTQDTMIPTGDNRQSRGIQIDIEKIPIDAKDVLMVEPRVASWQSDANGEMKLKHDVSLEPSQQQPRGRRPISERTMEAVVSGTTKSGGYYERGVQMTSKDEYEGIIKPPMFNCSTTSTQTLIRRREGIKTTATMTEVLVEPVGPQIVHPAQPTLQQVPASEIITTVTSASEEPAHLVEVISSGRSAELPDSGIVAPSRERVSTVSPATKSTAIAVSTAPSAELADAWTGTDVVEEPVPIIQRETAIKVHSAPPVEATPVPITVRYGLIQTPYHLHYEGSFVGEVEKPKVEVTTHLTTVEMPLPERVVLSTAKSQVTYIPEVKTPGYVEATTGIIDRPKESVISSSEVARRKTVPSGTMTNIFIKSDQPDVLHSAPPIAPQLPQAEVYTAVTSFIEHPSHPAKMASSAWSPEHIDAGIAASEKKVTVAVTSAPEKPASKVYTQTIGPMTERGPNIVNRGMETIVFEDAMPLIKKESTVAVRSAPPIEATPTPVTLRYGLVKTPFQLQGIVTGKVEPTVVETSTSRMVELETKVVQIPAPAKVVLSSVGSQITYIPEHHVAGTEGKSPSKVVIRTVQVQAIGKLETFLSTSSKPEMRSVEIQAVMDLGYMETATHAIRRPKDSTISSAELTKPATMSTATMTEVLIQPEQTVVERSAPPIPRTGLERRNSGTAAPAIDIYTTTSSVSKAPVSKVSVQAIGITTEPLATFVDAWTETVVMEKAMPVIKRESTVMVQSAPPVETKPIQLKVKFGLIQTPYQLRYEGIMTGEVEKPKVMDTSALTIAEMKPKVIEMPLSEKVVLSSAKSQTIYIPEHYVAVAKAVTPSKPIMRNAEVQAIQTVKYVEVVSTEPIIRSVEIQAVMVTGQAETVSQMMDVAQGITVTSSELPRPKLVSNATMTEVRIEAVMPPVEHTSPSTKTRKLLTKRTQVIGITTEPLASYVDAWTEAMVIDEPTHLIREERTESVVHTAPPVEAKPAPIKVKFGQTQTPIQEKYEVTITAEIEKTKVVDTAVLTKEGIKFKAEKMQVPPRVEMLIAKTQVDYIPEQRTVIKEKVPTIEVKNRTIEVQATTASDSMLSLPKRPLMHSLEVQALMSSGQAETTTHVSEVPQSLIVTSTAIPHRITTSTSTMSEATIELAKPIVLHSVPPTATATSKSEVTSSFLRPDTVLLSQALERPTEVINSEWILDHKDAEARAPLKEMSGIVSSASEAPLPKTVLQDISVLTKPIFCGVNRGTQTIVFVELMPLIKKEETVTVSLAPPVEATSEPTLVRFGAMETPLQFLRECSITSVLSEPVVTGVDAQTTEDLEPKIMSTQYFSKGTTVDASAQGTHISEQQVVVTEGITSLKMKLQTVGVQAAEKPEPEKVVPTLSTVTTVGVQALALPGYVETISHIAEESKTEVSRPVSKSTAIMTDLFIEPERPTVVHAAPPTQPLEPSTTAISSGCSPDYADVSITAPSKEVLTTASSVTEPLTPKVSTQVISMVTELLPLSVDASTEPMKVEEPEPLIEKEERTFVAHAAPPTETAPIVSFVKICHLQTPPASKTPNSVCTSTMTLLEIVPQATDVAYAAPPHPLAPALEKAEVTDKYMQTQPPQVAESLTMTEVSVVKSINLQTEESEFIWEEEVPTYTTMKYNAVETILMPSKHRSIQCSLIDSPAESIELTRSPEEFAYEEVEVNETYYKFTDTQVVETQTERVPLMHWAEFSPSTGFSSMQSSREFYELFRSVRSSTWDRCVTEELEEYFSNVGYSMMNTDIYDETLSRGYLKEYSYAVEEVEKYMGAEVGIQFPYETIVHEPFEYETSTKSEQSVEESYTMRRRLGQIRETESIALPTTKDFGVQIKLEPGTSVTESSVIEIKKTDQVFAYQQPVESKAITIDRGHQTELDSTVTTYHMQKTDMETAYSHITDVIHVVDEPMYVKTQVCISTVTEASQTEPLSYDYLRQQLEGLSKPEAKSFRHDCLHDLDIMTYFFDQDAHEEEYLQREQESYLVLPMGQPETEKLPITIRQRIVEYELCDMMTQIDARSWNDIREVASPITGLFAPVSFAVRQGWIQLGRQNEYIDPTTGHAIPLETALAQGRIRFANTASPNGNFASSLVYIERESAVQERADATFVLNTVNREYIPIRQAQLDGLIRKDENQVTWVLNSLDNTWITAEEAISQNILKVDKIYDQKSDEEVKRRQQKSVVRAYHVTAIRPGGEPCEWLRPEDAVRLGLFNRQTGDVAVDWPSRPSYQPFESGKTPPPEFAVSQWCNFLTARQAGWIRLVTEMNINKWIPLSQPSGSGGNRRLLSTSVSLLSSRAGRPDQDQSDLYGGDDNQRSGRPQVVVRQYSPYVPDTMLSHLGSGSHSPEYETESSRTPPYLTEVGEFEHSEVYVLSSSHHGHIEVSGEQISHQEEHSGSHRTLEVGDGQFYSYLAASYPSDEPVSTVRHEFEEFHAYEDSNRGHYSGEQSSTWSRSQHYTGQVDEQTRYSKSGLISRYSDSDQRR